MTYEQEGVYRRLLDHQWMEGSIPADPQVLASLLPKMSRDRFLEIWPLVSGKFRPRGIDRLVNDRLEVQRKERDRFVKTQRANVRKRWDNKTLQPTPGNTMVLPSNYSSTSSSSSTAVSKSAAPTLISRGESLNWDRRHGRHLLGFCDWVCFPQDQADEFAAKIPGDDGELKASQVREWAVAIRGAWADRIIPDGSPYDFWRHRWTETHGGSKPSASTLKAVNADRAIDEAFR